MRTYRARRVVNDDGTMEYFEWPIYESEEEFREHEGEDAELVYWKEAEEGYEGFLLDDDGCISECRQVVEFEDSRGYSRRQVHFQWGKRYPSNVNEFGFFSNPKEHWASKVARHPRMKIILKALARITLSGRMPTEQELVTFGKFYRNDQEIPEATLKRFLRTQEAKDVIAEEIVAILNRYGVDEEFITKEYLDVLTKSKSANQFGVSKSVVDELRNLIGMNPSKVKVTKGYEEEMTVEQLYESARQEALPDARRHNQLEERDRATESPSSETRGGRKEKVNIEIIE